MNYKCENTYTTIIYTFWYFAHLAGMWCPFDADVAKLMRLKLSHCTESEVFSLLVS